MDIERYQSPVDGFEYVLAKLSADELHVLRTELSILLASNPMKRTFPAAEQFLADTDE